MTLYDILVSNSVSIIIFLTVFVLVWWTLYKPRNLPPGPIPWPIVGNFPSLRGDTLKAIGKLREKYGDVYSLYLGNCLVVHVHGYNNLKEVLDTRGEEFVDRPDLYIFKVRGRKGIVSSSQQTWKDQRRYTLHTLRNFGFGKSSLESKVIEETGVLIQRLVETGGKTFCFEKLLHTSVSNVICSIAFGHRFEHDDQEFKEFMRTLDENFKVGGFAGIMNFMSWLRYIPGDPFKFKHHLNNVFLVDKLIQEQIFLHKQSFDPENLRDFIDAYLKEKHTQDVNPNSTFSDSQLAGIVRDLFVAGTETTSTTLLWALIYLINNPDVQTKLREEIHTVVGKSRFPSMADRKNMPYTEATLMEIQRCGDIVPFNVAHSATVDTSLHGYNIPRGTTVVPMLTTLLKDPTLWKNPEHFDPSRFLNSDGQFVKSEKSIPFSAGKRVCLGESLARMELFLFLTSMLQRFVFKAPEGVATLNPNAVVGITRYPEPFELRAIADI